MVRTMFVPKNSVTIDMLALMTFTTWCQWASAVSRDALTFSA